MLLLVVISFLIPCLPEFYLFIFFMKTHLVIDLFETSRYSPSEETETTRTEPIGSSIEIPTNQTN